MRDRQFFVAVKTCDQHQLETALENAVVEPNSTLCQGVLRTLHVDVDRAAQHEELKKQPMKKLQRASTNSTQTLIARFDTRRITATHSTQTLITRFNARRNMKTM